jgi:uncharacterized delta-60 repeat protein
VMAEVTGSNFSFEFPGQSSFTYWSNMTTAQRSAFAWTGAGNTGSGGPANFTNGSGWAYQNVPDGNHGVSLQRNASISQTVTFPATGNYTLSWKAASRVGQVNPYEVRIDGVAVTSAFSTSDQSWQPQAVNFDIAAGAHVISFHGLTPSDDVSVGIDAIKLERYVGPGVRTLASYQEVVSREVSLVVASPDVPEAVTGITTGFEVTTATTQYAAIDVNWNSYNEAAQRDIMRYRIYVGTSFFDTVVGMTPFKMVADGTQRHVIYGTGTNGQVISPEQIYYVAVVAEDVSGQFNPVVYSESVKASVGALGDVSNVVATPAPSSITYTWDLGGVGTNLQNFVKGFRVYISGANLPSHLLEQPILIGPSLRTWTATSLAFGTTYTMRIATVDVLDQESAGITVVATTLTVPPGDLEIPFNPGADNVIRSTVMYDQQSMLIGGDFSSIGGVSRNRLAKMDLFGIVNTTFQANMGTSGNITGIVVLPDGKILICGSFDTVGGLTRTKIARLYPDGALDTSFNVTVNGTVRCMVQSGGDAIIIGGDFTTVNGVTRNRLAKLTSSGTLDATFNPNANDIVRSVLEQSSGKLLIGGSFTTMSGQTRNRFARLNADGTLDSAFNINANSFVSTITQLADNSIILGGDFTSISGITRNYAARYSADGVIDAAYNPNANALIWATAVQSDGKCLIGGNFTTVNGVTRTYCARLLPDGTIDSTFNPSFSGTSVLTLMLQPDGKIVAGGTFTNAGGQSRNRLARLYNNPAISHVALDHAGQITWMRGGTSSEAEKTIFDVSIDQGANWISLGLGTRIANGWRITGLNVPPYGILRSRAKTYTGQYNTSIGYIENRRNYSVYSNISDWRQFYFQSSSNTGNAANMADPDGDGVVNLLEYAFGLHPLVASTEGIPQWAWTNAYGTSSFAEPTGMNGVTYGAEWSQTMEENDWHAIPDTGTGSVHTFTFPRQGASKLFVRWKITDN